MNNRNVFKNIGETIKMKKKIYTIIFLILSVSLICFGCGGNDVDDASKQYEITEPKTQEEAVESIRANMWYWFGCAGSETGQNDLNKALDKYEDFDVTDEMFDAYIESLTKISFDSAFNMDWSKKTPALNILRERYNFSEQQNYVLDDIEECYTELDYLIAQYNELDIPSYCHREDFNFDINESGKTLNAYALREVEGLFSDADEIDGYRIALFTDYSSSFWGVEPERNHFYYLYYPQEGNVYEGVWTFDDLYYVGTREYDNGSFSYNAPILFKPNNEDYYVVREYSKQKTNIENYIYFLESTIASAWYDVEYKRNPPEIIVSEDGYEWIPWEEETLGFTDTTVKSSLTEKIYARSGPGLDYDTVGSLHPGETLYVLDYHGGWCQFRTDRSIYGFIQTEYTELELYEYE